ncbi:phasin family protein [Heliophilum fasciatum]|uniref:Polyhydroxyalkanoate synthesis regulator phasin n=1 Tax=Heliophilum fasciatum TaxID=35700 RepID=A0A4R2RCB8_9FIRM|nr:hypothetical protein [Heliophilum fasciatum]MCW2279163.1 polyhydroxyalkanoate synthesis regulator phasin [Heliophilum fasciatum]TCP61022.1 polyhydroxyalkanoate synthesis regulator phasin [Heliophilum fasciatum]
MKDVFRRTLLAGLGAVSLTKERAESIVDELVKKGELSKDEAAKTVSELLDKSKEQREAVGEAIKTEVSKLRSEFGFVTRKEYDALLARVTVIEEKLGIKPVDEVVEAEVVPTPESAAEEAKDPEKEPS